MDSDGRGRYRGLLIDYGGVLTSNLFDSFRAFCEVEGLAPETIGQRFRSDRACREPEACVFVDDLPFNLDPAARLGMATVHHVSAEQTISELERLLGVELRERTHGPAHPG